MVEHQTPESKKSDREREDQGDRQRRSPGLSMPCSLRRTWRFFRSAVHSPTSSVARKHAERGESAGCHAGTGPYALCNKVGHHAGAGPVGTLSLTGLGPGPRRPGCCPKTSRPTTNSTLICELSCRARYAGKIAPCVSCTDNGRYFYRARCGHHRHAHRLSNPRGHQAGCCTSHAPHVALAPRAGNPDNGFTSSPGTTE